MGDAGAEADGDGADLKFGKSDEPAEEKLPEAEVKKNLKGKEKENPQSALNIPTGGYKPIPLVDGRTLYLNEGDRSAYFMENGKKNMLENVWLQPFEFRSCSSDEDESCDLISELPVTAYQNMIGQTVIFVSKTQYGDKTYNRVGYNVIMGDAPDLSVQTASESQLASMVKQLNGMDQAMLDSFLAKINDSMILIQLVNEPSLNESVRTILRARLAALKEQKRERRKQEKNKNRQDAVLRNQEAKEMIALVKPNVNLAGMPAYSLDSGAGSDSKK